MNNKQSLRKTCYNGHPPRCARGHFMTGINHKVTTTQYISDHVMLRQLIEWSKMWLFDWYYYYNTCFNSEMSIFMTNLLKYTISIALSSNQIMCIWNAYAKFHLLADYEIHDIMMSIAMPSHFFLQKLHMKAAYGCNRQFWGISKQFKLWKYLKKYFLTDFLDFMIFLY